MWTATSYLTSLNLDNNHIDGNIPKWIGSLGIP